MSSAASSTDIPASRSATNVLGAVRPKTAPRTRSSPSASANTRRVELPDGPPVPGLALAERGVDVQLGAEDVEPGAAPLVELEHLPDQALHACASPLLGPSAVVGDVEGRR